MFRTLWPRQALCWCVFYIRTDKNGTLPVACLFEKVLSPLPHIEEQGSGRHGAGTTAKES